MQRLRDDRGWSLRSQRGLVISSSSILNDKTEGSCVPRTILTKYDPPWYDTVRLGSRCRSVFKTREFRFNYLTNLKGGIK
jgi:hypothetical protein